MGVGVGLQAVGLVVGLAAARQQQAIANMEAQSYREQAEIASIQAKQDEEERNLRLRQQLASLGTTMAAGNIVAGPTSRTVYALGKGESELAKKDIANIRLMGFANRRKYEISAKASRAGGRAAMLGGLVGAAATGYDIYTGNKG